MGYYWYENRRRERLSATTEHQENSEFYDLTDKENIEFRVRWESCPQGQARVFANRHQYRY